MTDTQGHLLHVKVHAANTYDGVAGCSVFEEALNKYPTLQGVCADAGYRKTFELFVQNVYSGCLSLQKIGKFSESKCKTQNARKPYLVSEALQRSKCL